MMLSRVVMCYCSWSIAILTGAATVGSRTPADAATTRFDVNGTVLVNGQKAFPIGLSEPPPRLAQTPYGADALAAVTGAGVSVFRVLPLHYDWGVSGGTTSGDLTYVGAWNQAAAAHGAMTWVSLRNLSHAQPGTKESQTLNRVVTALRGAPGLGMWKGYDEPYLHRVGATSLRFSYTATRNLDPNHLWVTIQAPLGTAAALRPYSAVTDVHGVDVYPVKYGITSPDLHAVGRWTSVIRSVTPRRSVFTTLQICASTSRNGSGGFVLPTRMQERFMVYDAIMSGARGLNFYGGRNQGCFSALDRRLDWNWTFWYRVLKPILNEIRPGGPVHPALLVPASGLGMSTSDPYTRIMSRVSGNTIWVIAARRGYGTRRVTMRGLPTTVRAGRRLDGKWFRVSNGAFSDDFGRHRVHIYRFPRPS